VRGKVSQLPQHSLGPPIVQRFAGLDHAGAERRSVSCDPEGRTGGEQHRSSAGAAAAGKDAFGFLGRVGRG
jgi:hypothetical protein